MTLRSDLEPVAGLVIATANSGSVKCRRLDQNRVDAEGPGSVAANAGLIRSFLGVNSGFGFADGLGFGRGCQNAGAFLEIGSDEYFDHTGGRI